MMGFDSRRPSKLILKGTPEELGSFMSKKVQLIATHCTEFQIVCETATSEECTKISHLARNLVLILCFNGEGSNEGERIAVATSRAMMKTIASLSVNDAANTNALMGGSVFGEAMVDGWMTFVWNCIDLPFQATLLLLEDENIDTTTATEKEGIEEDLKIALNKVETHLSKQKSRLSSAKINHPISLVATNATGSHKIVYTIADLSLAVTLYFMRKQNIAVSAMRSDENPYLHSLMQRMNSELTLVPETS